MQICHCLFSLMQKSFILTWCPPATKSATNFFTETTTSTVQKLMFDWRKTMILLFFYVYYHYSTFLLFFQSFPFFGVEPVLLDESGKEIHGPGEGYLVFKKPWPGMMRTLFGNHERFQTTYFNKFPGYYCTGDGKHFSISLSKNTVKKLILKS